MKTNGKSFRYGVKALLAIVIVIALSLSTVVGTASALTYDVNTEYDGKFYTDYDSIESVHAAAAELNGQIVAEGTVLMKNDGTLPLNPLQHRVSVFGVRSADIQEGVNGSAVGKNAPDSMADGLRNAGFAVNTTLEQWYSGIRTRTESQEVGIGGFGDQFTGEVERSFSSYRDAAVIVIQRCELKENKDASTSLTGNTSNRGDYTNNVTGQLAGNRPYDGPRQLQDEVDPDAEDGEPYSWEHAYSSVAPAIEGETPDENGNVEVKHYLQLTDSEIALIDYVKTKFKRIVVAFNSSTTFEMFNLERDPQINALVWFGRPGIQYSGVTAVAKILSGEINPSGGVSAEYTKDFTSDPTWFNNGTGRQFRYGAYSEDVPGDFVARYEDENGKYLTAEPGSTGIAGIRSVDYEEGIYLGYKFYETYWYETLMGNTSASVNDVANSEENVEAASQWYFDNIVYPFGFGLSYTNFEFEMGEIFAKNANTGVSSNIAGKSIDGSIFASTVGNPAQVKELYVPVKVTNVGGVAGKKSVQIYMTAPYVSGEIEKSFVKLVGFGKTDILAPGKSQVVVVKIDVQDMSSYDYNDANNNGNAGYEMDEGTYTLRAMDNSSMLISQEIGTYDDASFTITDKINMKLDNFSDLLSTPVFSDINTKDYSIRTGGSEIGAANASEDAGMVIFSRSDFDGTFPEPPTVADLTLKNTVIQATKDSLGKTKIDSQERIDYLDGEDQPWFIPDSEFNEGGAYADWTQASAADVANRQNGLAEVLLYQMSGVPIGGSTIINGEEFTWDDFMNQLTYAEMASLINGSGTPALACIDKAKAQNADRPLNLSSTFTWADAPLQAATFNVDLIYRLGQIVGEFALHKVDNGAKNSAQLSGWWGPGANTNRSPFAGRTKEYYSQDSVLAGYIGAASTQGAQNKGCNVYIKHYALYDQEDMNAGTTVWVDEQTMRENYLLSFKKIYQDGGASSGMMSCWRIGQTQIAASYALMTQITKNEWGWQGEMATDHTGGQNSPAWSNPAAGTDPETSARITKYDWTSGNMNCTDLLVRIGGVSPMSSGGGTISGTWDEAARGGMGGVRIGSLPVFDATKDYAVGDYVQITTGSGRNVVTKYYKFIAAHAAGAFNAAEAQELQLAECLDQLTLSNIQYYYVRNTAMYNLYQASNSRLVLNGVATRKYVNKTMNLTQGTAANESIGLSADDLNGSKAVYSVISGSLPEGLSLNASTGVITGTPSALANNSKAEVKMTADGWIRKTITLTFNVASSWTNTLEAGTVGVAYTGSVTCGVTSGSGTASYSIVSGELPTGLDINATTGAITGTPVKSGTYNFTVKYSRGNANYVSEQFSIVIGGTDPVEVPHDVEFRVNDGKIQWKYLDGSVWTDIIAISELKGEDGKDGVDGTDGANGIDGKSVEFKEEDSKIMWRYVGDEEWTEIYDFSGISTSSSCNADTGVVGAVVSIVLVIAIAGVVLAIAKRREDSNI